MPSPDRIADPWPAYGAGWLGLGAVYAASLAASGAPGDLAARAALLLVLSGAPVGLLTLALAGRAFARGGLPSAGLVALLAAALATGVWALLAAGEAWLRLGAPRWPAANIVVWQSFIDGTIHLTLAALACAWHSARQVSQAREAVERAESLRSRAELQLLRSQLNPHFLLNTLHALLGLVRREPATAEAAIERLGELLRAAMSVTQRGDDRISLREEWALVGHYLELERLRLGSRLHSELCVDESALDVAVPPFALQPLVENAVTHAVAPRATGGRIRVSAERTGDRVRLAVADDGPGLREAEALASPRSGLRLLRERLAFLYGAGARLTFEAGDGGGLRVVLDLPAAGPGDAR